MPSLEAIGLDWFHYLIPQKDEYQERIEECDHIDDLTEIAQNPMRMLANLMEVKSQITLADFLAHFGQTDINARDKLGRTALHKAAIKNDVTICSKLLEYGASINVIDRYKFSPYGLALRDESYAVADLMLDHLTSIDNSGAGTFGSLVHLLVNKLKTDHLERLVQFADLNHQEPLNGDTVLHKLMFTHSIKQGSEAEKCLKIVLDQADVDVNKPNYDGLTPLHVAVQRQNKRAVETLIRT